MAAALLAALLAAGSSAQGAPANALTNPGFESGAQAPWADTYNPSHSVDSTSGFVYGSGTIHEPAHSGQYAMKEWGCYWGNFVQTHTIYQDIPAAPSSVWSADVWAYTATPDNVKGQNFGELLVIFYGAITNELGRFSSGVVNGNTPVNTWLHLVATNSLDGTTNLPAPAGTAFARFGLFFSQDAAESGGSVYWDDANLIKTASSDPEISASPQDVTVIYGQTATFTVQASGATPLSYQWMRNTVNLTDVGGIGGSKTATLTITNATTANMGYYSVTVTDQAGSLTSPSSGYLNVLDPGILANPVSLQRVEGQSATFTVVAAGSGTLNYTWYKGATPLSNDSRISGADSPALTINNLTVADSDNYSVVITGASVVTSGAASLYVNTAAQASQLMRNGGFESGLAYWTAWNGYVAVGAPPGAGETNYDGNEICEIFGTGNGTWNGVNQSFPTVPGYVYEANGWFLISAGAPITGASTAWLEVNFYQNGNMIGNFQSPILSSSSPTGIWTNLAVPYAVAPAGANEVRCQINYHAGDGGGAVFVDSVMCWLRIPVAITPLLSGTNLNLSFPTQIGVSYQVLYKNDLTDAAWQLLTTVTGDLTGQATVPAPMVAGKRFYRMVIVPACFFWYCYK